VTTSDDSGPPLRPEREAAVRRLLGSTGDAEPMPREVGARLDAALDDLVRERSEETGARVVDYAPTAPVTHLSARRRRVVAALFVAAAAVVVAGIGVPLLHQQPDDTRISAATDGAADRSTPTVAAPSRVRAPSHDAVGRLAPAKGLSPQKRPGASALDGILARGGTRDLHRGDLRAQLLALRAATRTTALRYQRQNKSPASSCDGGFGAGRLVPVRYDGAPAVVAFRPPVGSAQLAEVLRCGTGHVLRSVTLPR